METPSSGSIKACHPSNLFDHPLTAATEPGLVNKPMNLDFVSALCEEFAQAISSVMPPDSFTPQECWDPVTKVFGNDFDSRTLAKATGRQISDLRAAFAQFLECEDITEAHMRLALAAVLRRWPAK